MAKGSIVAGCLAPHPPHLVYAENPEQNEPVSEGGWEQLRWGYERLRESLKDVDYDVIVILSPHWQTYIGTHFIGVEKCVSKSVDPVFPNLFRFNYDLTIDVELAKAIHDQAKSEGMSVKMMENPDFRVDYGTLVSCHMVRPEWDKPIVSISSNRSLSYYSVEVMQEMMLELGRSTAKAIEESGKKCLLIASNSLSHRHFVTETNPPEDMSMIELMRQGKSQQIIDEMPEFCEQAIAETDGGALTWILSAMGVPSEPAILHGYGTIIGTGNAIMEWPCRTWGDE